MSTNHDGSKTEAPAALTPAREATLDARLLGRGRALSGARLVVLDERGQPKAWN